jgi:hypothetical protein
VDITGSRDEAKKNFPVVRRAGIRRKTFGGK